MKHHVVSPKVQANTQNLLQKKLKSIDLSLAVVVFSFVAFQVYSYFAHDQYLSWLALVVSIMTLFLSLANFFTLNHVLNKKSEIPGLRLSTKRTPLVCMASLLVSSIFIWSYKDPIVLRVSGKYHLILVNQSDTLTANLEVLGQTVTLKPREKKTLPMLKSHLQAITIKVLDKSAPKMVHFAASEKSPFVFVYLERDGNLKPQVIN